MLRVINAEKKGNSDKDSNILKEVNKVKKLIN